MKLKKIFPQFLYIPIFKFEAYKGSQKKSFKNSLYYYKNSISLPIYYNLTLKEQKYVIKIIKNFKNNEKNK